VTWPVTDELLARIQGLLDGTVIATEPRDAATVVLLRDAKDGPGVETFLMRRHQAMTFGGLYVFPGGAVDPADATVDIAWAGPDAAWWARAFRCSEPLARELVCAAVRETFEESGVLLAGPTADEVLADVSTDEWEAERVALEAREQSLSALLARRGLVLRADLLRPLAHWITPEIEQRRFDTRFFLAALPEGQRCREAGNEADHSTWVPPSATGDLPLLLPTVTALRNVADLPDVAAALDRAWEFETIRPVLEKTDDGGTVLVPYVLKA
jgi:8-oxo-dGTP pyrophosphatase MutT (NUDIX family)